LPGGARAAARAVVAMPASSQVAAPVTARLAALLAEARRADDRVRELEAEQLGARRAVDRELAPLTAYFEGVAAGERQPDAAEEARLRDAVTRAQADVVLRPSTAHGRLLGMEPVNVRVEALLAGARRAAEQARADLARFAADEFDALAPSGCRGPARSASGAGGCSASWRSGRTGAPSRCGGGGGSATSLASRPTSCGRRWSRWTRAWRSGWRRRGMCAA
jgi:hypothetical protein